MSIEPTEDQKQAAAAFVARHGEQNEVIDSGGQARFEWSPTHTVNDIARLLAEREHALTTSIMTMWVAERTELNERFDTMRAELQERIDQLEGERDLVHVDIYEHLLHKAPNMGVALHIDGTAQELVGDVIAWVDKAAEALAGRDVVSLQTFRRVEEERDAAKTEVARLRKLFDDAGQGEHNVLALVDHYQDVAIRAESKQRIDGEHVVMLSHDHAGDNSVHALCAGMVWHDVAEATAAVMTRAVAEGMKQQLWSSSANIAIVDVKTFIKASNSGDLVAALFSDAVEGGEG